MAWYAVKNVTDDSAEISIFDEIGFFGVSAKSFIAELKSLGDRHVTVRINSPGGEIFDGNAIYNALLRHPGGVTVAIDSLAASMATVIAMAGDKRTIAENGMFMIHNPWTVAAGESKDLRRQADLLDDLKSNIVSAYASRTGIERSELQAMMDDETWLTAQEALDYGFVTEITEPQKMAAKFSGNLLDKFDKLPQVMARNKKPEVKAEEIPAEAPAEEVKPEVEESAAEVPAAEEEVAPEVEVEDTAQVVSAVNALKQEAAVVPQLLADLEVAHAEIAKRESEIKSQADSLAKLAALYEDLKNSLGLSPAKVVPEIAQAPEQVENISPEAAAHAKWVQLAEKDPKAAQKFYIENKAAILAHKG